MTKSEMEEIAEQAAQKTLANFFLTVGVDITDPQEVIKFQADMRHIRRWRDANETVQKHALRTAVGVIVTGFISWIGLLLWKGH
jgi:hypothetical protein